MLTTQKYVFKAVLLALRLEKSCYSTLSDIMYILHQLVSVLQDLFFMPALFHQMEIF